MYQNSTYAKSQLRELASLISTSGFKKLSISNNQSMYIRKMKKYVNWECITENKPSNLGELIAFSYKILEEQYRHEYIYKNKLLNAFVLKNYALDDTILLNEFRIGQSIADAVLINGTNKVFEIKTELDTPERLKTQLDDYFKAFSEVYVFTHINLLDKYLSLLPSIVGILLYTENGDVIEHRKATSYYSQLDPINMMASLRKEEYTKLVKELVGYIPEATPAFFYSSCLNILKDLPVIKIQKEYCKILKMRINHKTNYYLTLREIPLFINFSFYQTKIDVTSYRTILNNLSKKIL